MNRLDLKNLRALHLAGVLWLLASFATGALAQPTLAGTLVTNQAVGSHSTKTVTSPRVTTEVTKVCGLSVTPNGTILEPGQRTVTLPGNAAYLTYAVTNTGNATDHFLLGHDVLTLGTEGEGDPLEPETVTLYLVGEDGPTDVSASAGTTDRAPFASPLSLAPGETAHVLVEVQTPAPAAVGQVSGRIHLDLTGACADDPDVNDSGNVGEIAVEPAVFSSMSKSATPDEDSLLYPGASVTYSIEFATGAHPLTNVIVTDKLHALLTDVRDATNGVVEDPSTGVTIPVEFSAGDGELTWTLPAVPANTAVTLSFTATVAAYVPAGTHLSNVAVLSSSSQAATPTNEVVHDVAPSEVTLSKTANASNITFGDTLGYTLTVTNPSAVAPLVGAVLSDVLPRGTEFVEGSATINATGAGEPVGFAPRVGGNALTWELPDLQPNESLTVTFDVLVTTDALGSVTLENVAQVMGQGGTQVVAQDSAVTRVDAGVFDASAVLQGRAFVDTNDNGRFDEGTDEPVANLRLFLAGGLSIVTDQHGHYTFDDLHPGLDALRVDASTVPAGLELAPTTTEEKAGLWRLRLHGGLIERLDVPFTRDNGQADEDGTTAERRVMTFGVDQPHEPVRFVSPDDNSLVTVGDASRVTVETPYGSSATLYVNDIEVAKERIGTTVLDPTTGRQTFEYVAVKLTAGPNVFRVEAETAGGMASAERTVYLAGATSAVTFTPINDLVAGSVEPLAFAVSARDAWGNAPTATTLTLDVHGARPAAADAAPQQVGYQVALEDGEGLLTIEPLAKPGEVTLVALLGNEDHSQTFTVKSGLRPWVASGVASFGVGLDPSGDLGVQLGAQATFFVRGAIGDWLLTAAGSPRAGGQGDYNPREAFGVTGASTAPVREAPSSQQFFVRLENDLTFVQYGDFSPAFEADFLRLSRSYTGVSAAYDPVGSPVELTAYVTYERTDGRVDGVELAADGTSAYRLPHERVIPDSLRLKVIKRDANGTVLNDPADPRTGELRVLRDYSFDGRLGLVQLARPLPTRDAGGNRYYLVANYRLDADGDAPRYVQAGAQVLYEVDEAVTLHAGAYLEQASASDRYVAVAAGARYDDGALSGEANLAYGTSSGVGGVAFSAKVGYDTEAVTTEAAYEYYSGGYRSADVKEPSAHQSATATVTYRPAPNWTVQANGAMVVRPTADDSSVTISGGVTGTFRAPDAVMLGNFALGRPSATLGVEYAGGVRAVAGLSLADVAGVSGFGVDLTHRQAFGASGRSETDVRFTVPLLDFLDLSLAERVVWGQESFTLVGLNTTLQHGAGSGSTDVRAQYELPGGLSGNAGRLLLGVDTTYPLSDVLSVGGGVEQEFDLTGEGKHSTVVTTAVDVNTDDFDLASRYELRLADTVKHVAGATLTFAGGTSTFGTFGVQYMHGSGDVVQNGFRVNAAGAYRGDAFDLLTRHTAEFGSLAPDAEAVLSGDTRVTFPLGAQFTLQASYLYRYTVNAGLFDLASVGVGAGLWDGGSVDLYGRVFHSWARQELSYGATVELSQRLGCGLNVAAGYNLGGTTSAPGLYTDPGLYVRLDVVFDEEWRCGKGQ